MGEWGSGGSKKQTQSSFELCWLSLKTAIDVPHSRGNCCMLNLVYQSVERLQIEIPAMERSIQEVKNEWNLP